ncbi:MAG: DUF515 domain-containing protein [Methanosphaera sp.]|uniref:DUF515 domain-containing protein n=1 Tax=Methanosphaera sp. TaxID=2666342 RepID=UPI0025D35628|nr:DUF515 domain-containing protein [Methanosphaera sp.]MCI5866920.1 DUF515 domain-containing protein [Methanosphaera sp.]MDD6534427.1 DUF515 domain-containing protein [Methanosphaera sp.]
MKKLDKILNSKFSKHFKELKEYLKEDNQNKKPSLHKNHKFRKEDIFDYKNYSQKDQELITGTVVCIIVIVVLLSIGYYFLVFAPEAEKLDNAKNMKINEVNMIFSDDLTYSSAKQSLTSEIYSAKSVAEVDAIDVKKAAYPVIKNKLLDDINQMKDRYKRVAIRSGSSITIASIKNATEYINTAGVDEIIDMKIEEVDTTIIPLTITRKQAASGLIDVNDIVDIYTTNPPTTDNGEDEFNENSTQNNTNNTTIPVNGSEDNNETLKLAGGAQIISILRAQDAGSINSNIATSNNTTTSTSFDIQQIQSAKAAGIDETQKHKINLTSYGSKLTENERTSNIADLNAQYIIMVEVPKQKVNDIISNMDNIILTIPTSNAPDWVKIKA